MKARYRAAAGFLRSPKLVRAFGVLICALSTPSFAQVLDHDIPFDYDRGRNVSVMQRPRPSYDALGIRVRSFIVYPSLTSTLNYTDNVYSSSTFQKSDGYAQIMPSMRVASDWGRHSLSISSGGEFKRYFDQTARNATNWNVAGNGRLDVTDTFSLTALARSTVQDESRYVGTAGASVATAAQYQDTQGALRATYLSGKHRVSLAGNFDRLTFDPFSTLAGTRVDQANRNRDVWRGSAQTEFALSPSFALYAKGSYTRTDYDQQVFPGVANRNSDNYQAIAGVSLDVTALIRGNFGLGYSHTSYDSSIYRNFGSLAMQGEIQYFPLTSTTFTIDVYRRPQDANIAGSGGYIATGTVAQIDHEFLDRLIGSLGFTYENDDYKGVVSKTNIYQMTGGVRYLVSNLISINATGLHGKRSVSGTINGAEFAETRGSISLVLHR